MKLENKTAIMGDIMHVQYSNGVTVWQRVTASGEHFESS